MPDPVPWIDDELVPYPPEPWCQFWDRHVFVRFIACHETRPGVFVLDEDFELREGDKLLFGQRGLGYTLTAPAQIEGGEA